LPHVHDEEWFFDTELLLLAERNGLRIHEVPVDWTDDPDSRVEVLRTALDDLRGMARVARRIAAGTFRVPVPPRVAHARLPRGMRSQLPSFAVIGVLSTLAHLLLYVLLRGGLGALGANALALTVTTIANTAANRRWTFRVRGRAGAWVHQAQGGLAFLVGLGLSSAALAGLHQVAEKPTRAVELAVLIGAGVVATVVRFLLLRVWVFRAAAGDVGGAVSASGSGFASGSTLVAGSTSASGSVSGSGTASGAASATSGDLA
jgi:putative flippase GtrA